MQRKTSILLALTASVLVTLFFVSKAMRSQPSESGDKDRTRLDVDDSGTGLEVVLPERIEVASSATIQLPPLLAAPAASGPTLPNLSRGIPSDILMRWRAFRGAADKLNPRIKDGTATRRSKHSFAKLNAFCDLISANRYWFIGPSGSMPALPQSTPYVSYYRVPLNNNNMAVFEVAASEFPLAVAAQYEKPPASGTAMGSKARGAVIERARNSLKR